MFVFEGEVILIGSGWLTNYIRYPEDTKLIKLNTMIFLSVIDNQFKFSGYA